MISNSADHSSEMLLNAFVRFYEKDSVDLKVSVEKLLGDRYSEHILLISRFQLNELTRFISTINHKLIMWKYLSIWSTWKEQTVHFI